jgi:PAS domain S-box-containing protein
MSHMQKVNILLVDDNPENLVALEAILGDLGQNLVKAHSGREALRYLLKHEVALILLDVEMPNMDGYETAALVREREKSRNTPIIFLTAINTTDFHVFKGYSVGAVDYLLKPLVPEVLRSKVLVFVDLFKKTEEIKRQAELLHQANRELDEINQEIVALNKKIESKNAELQIERDFISTVLHTAASLVVILDQQGRIVRFNRACEQLTGYSIDEVKGRPLWELFLLPDEVSSSRIVFENMLDGVLPIEREMCWVTKEGRRRLIAWTNTVLFGNDGSVEYVIGTGIDITERKRAEEERAQLIREQAARVEAEAAERRAAFLAEASAVLASSLDYQTTLASVARLAVPTLADWCIVYTFKEDGSPPQIEVAHADPAKEELAMALRRSPPNLDRGEHPAVRALRTRQPELLSDISDALWETNAENAEHLSTLRQVGAKSALAVPLLSRGRAFGVILFLAVGSDRRYRSSDLTLAQDLARRVAVAIDNAWLYQEAQEANRAKDEFLATVSHELRTPLNAILGWARMLNARKLDEATAARALETIERNAAAQAKLIEDILDVSRIIMGKVRLNLRPVELPLIIEAALDAARPMAEAKGVQLESALNPTVGIISGDPDRLQQVAWNLLSNAIKFTPRGGRVEVRIDHVDSHARIVVSDTGKGISPDFLPYVFERFRQAETGMTRQHGGLGLGLTIVRHLVELHGGTVAVESQGEGHGATFTVTLPIAQLEMADGGWRNEEKVVHEESALRTPHSAILGGLRILLVDDEADTLELLTLVLEQYGATVIAVSSSAEALEAMGRSLPDILVCDIGMPGEDGYALIGKVRARAAEQGGRLPAIALTAYARVEDRMRALAAGFQMHVPKPVEPVELVVVVASLAGWN